MAGLAENHEVFWSIGVTVIVVNEKSVLRTTPLAFAPCSVKSQRTVTSVSFLVNILCFPIRQHDCFTIDAPTYPARQSWKFICLM